MSALLSLSSYNSGNFHGIDKNTKSKFKLGLACSKQKHFRNFVPLLIKRRTFLGIPGTSLKKCENFESRENFDLFWNTDPF